MSSVETLPIKEIYKIHNRLPIIEETGFKQYPILKKYVGQQNQFSKKSLQKSITKRNLRLRTYLDEEQKRHKNIPGPGKYNLNYQWKASQQKKHNISDRRTFLDQIIRQSKRNKSPGPGQHQNQLINKTKSLIRSASYQQKSKQRLFYYHQNQYSGSQLPGPGQYNVNIQQTTSFRKNRETPEQNIKISKIKSEQKLKSLPKLPDMNTYNPQDSNFFTFNTASKVKPLKKSFGVGQRFKTEPIGSGLSPDKYDILNKWRGKKSSKKSYEKKGLDILSKPQPRVYN